MNNEGWAILCIFGFWGWVFFTINFILRAFSRQGDFDFRKSKLYAIGIAIGYAMWIVSMLNA